MGAHAVQPRCPQCAAAGGGAKRAGDGRRARGRVHVVPPATAAAPGPGHHAGPDSRAALRAAAGGWRGLPGRQRNHHGHRAGRGRRAGGRGGRRAHAPGARRHVSGGPHALGGGLDRGVPGRPHAALCVGALSLPVDRQGGAGRHAACVGAPQPAASSAHHPARHPAAGAGRSRSQRSAVGVHAAPQAPSYEGHLRLRLV
mmetsp:Transcript_29043/g.74109  ORF Transcript_29043/g.74109 Transcript_29043/m.74109 type:complete len:200 (-) Transcript_29043:295-894(-)